MKKNIKNYTARNTKGYQDLFDGTIKNYLMRNNNFSVGFNMPEALSGEATFNLPPYAKRMPYLVDKYPACPKEWMRSEGIVKSFFVPVIEGKGMWLDFNENNNHTHHVAIVVSVQGVNPITGMPCKDAQLEQYIEECPKHKIKFGPDRYCSKCDYKWPKQNYITTTATPSGMLWLDGFRTIDGIVRQYILTAEKMRGVASNIIGKDRVYAIGLSFFVSKEKKPKREYNSILLETWTTITDSDYYKDPIYYKWPDYTTTSISEHNLGGGTTASASYLSSTSPTIKSSFVQCSSLTAKYKASASRGISHSVQTKKLEIGAGSQINQSVYDDPEKLDFWHDKPESIICVNYVTENDARKIIEQGEINIEGHKEGFLKEVPVGN